MINKETANHIKGTTGERFIAEWLEKKPKVDRVILSTDPFDNKKDCVVHFTDVESKTLEIKAQTPYLQKESITIPLPQKEKIDTVDVVLILCTSDSKQKRNKYDGWLLQLKKDYKISEVKDMGTKKARILIKINEDNFHRIHEFSEEEMKVFRNLPSTSNYINFKTKKRTISG
ncbi:MAG: hypothetical protein H8E98_03925 [Bacteroidetes bacterium]|nr:hypothetical protein [Bacteroidota bacterium]